MATAYPELLEHLRIMLADYRAKRVAISDLQKAVWRTAEAVVSYEDRDLRKFLQSVEGKLDVLQFTIDPPEQFTASLDIIAALEDQLRKSLST